MHRKMLHWAASATVGLMLILAGCTGADAPADDEEMSPLGEYFSAFYGGDLSEEEQQAKYEAENKQREELVAQCMQDEGFEYIPVVNSMSFDPGVEWKPEDREFVAQWGYGAARYPGGDEPPEPEDIAPDPNSDYVSALSESEQTAYYEALYGPTPTEDEMSEDGSYEYDWETAGCYGWAGHEISGDDPLQSDEFADVMNAISTFYENSASLPAIADIDREWASCMDAAGYPGFATQADAQNSVYDELNAMYENSSTSETGVDEAALDEIHEREVDVALADLDCREETGYRDAYQKAQFEAEEQFIADHKTELDAMKAAAEQARS
ncbi:hypothetical protein [Microbacterium sp. cf332]|uniref:hypothetical protein n=1 Tax=Microbacterium sp. cf332 TaxID=1761804 RepID=UPI0008853462|nr:hypothetical protein [Microbacterium sp. cf332]SDQ85166.1 hypothetical protein SAMN04487847_2739 [Microbacterium sp. cf332]